MRRTAALLLLMCLMSGSAARADTGQSGERGIDFLSGIWMSEYESPSDWDDGTDETRLLAMPEDEPEKRDAFGDASVEGEAKGYGGNTIITVVDIEGGQISQIRVYDELATERMQSGYRLVAQCLAGQNGREVHARSAKELLQEVKRAAAAQGQELSKGKEDTFAADSAIESVKDALSKIYD